MDNRIKGYQITNDGWYPFDYGFLNSDGQIEDANSENGAEEKKHDSILFGDGAPEITSSIQLRLDNEFVIDKVKE